MTTHCCIMHLILCSFHNLCHMVGMPSVQLQLVSWLQSCAPFALIPFIVMISQPCLMSKELKGFIISLKLPKLWYSYKHCIPEGLNNMPRGK